MAHILGYFWRMSPPWLMRLASLAQALKVLGTHCSTEAAKMGDDWCLSYPSNGYGYSVGSPIGNNPKMVYSWGYSVNCHAIPQSYTITAFLEVTIHREGLHLGRNYGIQWFPTEFLFGQSIDRLAMEQLMFKARTRIFRQQRSQPLLVDDSRDFAVLNVGGNNGGCPPKHFFYFMNLSWATFFFT